MSSAAPPRRPRASSTSYLRALGEVAQATLDGAEPSDVFRRIAREARLLVGAESAAIGTFGPGPEILTIRGADGAGAERLEPGAQVPLAQTLAQPVAATGKTLVLGRDPPEPFRTILERFGRGPAICVPLVVGGQVFGAMPVGNARGAPAFRPHQVRLVEAFAGQAAIALEFVRVREQLRGLAVIEERERIARELHDGAIQVLFGLGIDLQNLARERPNPAVADRLESAVDNIDQAITTLRRYIARLHRSVLA